MSDPTGDAIPSSHTSMPLARSILAAASRLETAGFSDAARSLNQVASTCSRTTLHALVLGRFSVGKSTLINAFLGYPVLPGGLSPTTGVICRVSYGPPGAIVRYNDGRTETFSGPEALEPYLAMDAQGSAARLAAIVRVDVTLPLPLLQDGLEIVDSPGLDEAGARTAFTTSSLDSADVALFVLAADQLMSDVERRFLIEEVLSHSPGALALVVNFWDRIPDPERPAVLERLEEVASEIAAAWEGDRPRIPFFPISAARAVRSRWRPGSNPQESGIEALESWLTQQAANGPAVRARALQGRLRFSIGQARAAIDTERRQKLSALRTEEKSAAALRSAAASQTAGRQDAVRRIDAGAVVLLESLAVRTSAGEGSLRAFITEKLQKDAFDPLFTLQGQVDAWWSSLRAALQNEANGLIGSVADTLSAAGIPEVPADLPSLDLDTPAPDIGGRDQVAAKPVRDTVAGFIGGISKTAGDSAASWMRKASHATAGLDPRARRAVQETFEKFDAAVSLASYHARQQIRDWIPVVRTAAEAAAARQSELTEAELNRRQRQIQEIRTRLGVLTDLDQVLSDLIAEGGTSPTIAGSAPEGQRI